MIQRQSAVVVQVLLDQIEGIERPPFKTETGDPVPPLSQRGHAPWFYFAYMETKNLAKQEHKKAIEAELATEKLLIDIMKKAGTKGTSDRQYGACRRSNQGHASGLVSQEMEVCQAECISGKYAAFVIDLVETYLAVLNNDKKEGAIWILQTNPLR